MLSRELAGVIRRGQRMGAASTDIDYIKKAADDLIAVTKKFCGGEEKFLYAPWLDKWQRSGF